MEAHGHYYTSGAGPGDRIVLYPDLFSEKDPGGGGKGARQIMFFLRHIYFIHIYHPR